MCDAQTFVPIFMRLARACPGLGQSDRSCDRACLEMRLPEVLSVWDPDVCRQPLSVLRARVGLLTGSSALRDLQYSVSIRTLGALLRIKQMSCELQ